MGLGVHSHDQGSAPAVGEGGELVGELVPIRAGDTAAGQQDTFEFQGRVLTEPEATGEVPLSGTHGLPNQLNSFRSQSRECCAELPIHL